MDDRHIIFLHGRGSSAPRSRKWIDRLVASLRGSGFRIEAGEVKVLYRAPRFSANLSDQIELHPDFRLPESDPAAKGRAPEHVKADYVERQ